MNPLMSSNRMFRALISDGEMSDVFSTQATNSDFLAFEIALTEALGEVGDPDPALCAQAVEQMRGFIPDLDAIEAASPVDGMAVPEFVRQLKQHVGKDLSALVHVGATSQDLVDSSMALRLKAANDLIADRLGQVTGALDDLLASQGDHQIMARTRMQAALPIAASHRIESWRDPLTRHLDRLDHHRAQVETLQFGGPVGDRSTAGPKADEIAGIMARKLGLNPLPRARHSERDGWAEYAGWLSLITGSLGKIGQDICLMAQQGIDEIAMKGGGSSSAMAHKQNPIAAEILVTLARYNAGQLPLMHQALLHEQERSGASWTLEWMVLPAMVATTAKALDVARRQLAAITRIGTEG